MTFSNINVGTVPNDGTGDALRNAMIYVNSNFETARVNFQSQVTTNQLNLALANYVLTATYSAQIASMTASILSLNNSLAGKAPLVHTHTISQVTGLQTQLDNKVNTSTFNLEISSINNTVSELSSSKINEAPDDIYLYARANMDWEIIPRIRGGVFTLEGNGETKRFLFSHTFKYAPFSHIVNYNQMSDNIFQSQADDSNIIIEFSKAPSIGQKIDLNWVAFFSRDYRPLVEEKAK